MLEKLRQKRQEVWRSGMKGGGVEKCTAAVCSLSLQSAGMGGRDRGATQREALWNSTHGCYHH
eukprot:525275-Rhodomonas_salina.1